MSLIFFEMEFKENHKNFIIEILLQVLFFKIIFSYSFCYDFKLLRPFVCFKMCMLFELDKTILG